jgi:hypothetical protein
MRERVAAKSIYNQRACKKETHLPLTQSIATIHVVICLNVMGVGMTCETVLGVNEYLSRNLWGI